MYDQLTIFGGNSNPELTDDICAYIGIPRGRAEVFKFSNDNTFVRIGESVRENDVFVVQSFADPVLTVDLHAGQIQGFFDIPVDEMSAMSLAAEYFVDKRLYRPVVVSPDL